MSAGTCFVIEVQTAEGVTSTTRAEYRVLREGEEEAMVWQVEGQPGMEIRVTREDSDIATASSLLNRVPDVMVAPPGLRTLMEYDHLRPSCQAVTSEL